MMDQATCLLIRMIKFFINLPQKDLFSTVLLLTRKFIMKTMLIKFLLLVLWKVNFASQLKALTPPTPLALSHLRQLLHKSGSKG